VVKDILKRIILKICRDFINLFTKRQTNRIIFMQESSCGSNSYSLWKQAPNYIKEKYDLVLYLNHLDEGKGIINFIKKYNLIASSNWIISTHGCSKLSNSQKEIQLWHGFIAKKPDGVMKKNTFLKKNRRWDNVDAIISYSETYSTFFNAFMLADPQKYIITGAPRNDFLFKSDGISNIKKIFTDISMSEKIIFFLPTYRDSFGVKQGDKSNKNIFGFKNFDKNKFGEFLKDNNIKLIYKPHPHEEEIILEEIQNLKIKNILILKNKDLVENNLDLYELLNAADILLTDYSSIYYDFLLLDRPILFSPVDIKSYQINRGFLVESFESWVPGPTIFDQNMLEDQIKYCLIDKTYFYQDRIRMKNLIHRYQDGKSSQRLWAFLEKMN